MNHKFLWIGCLAAFSGVTAFSSAIPAIDRADLAANDLLDWSVAGNVGDNYFFTPLTTVGGRIVTASMPASDHLSRVDEGDGWLGNFMPGERLLYTDVAPGPLYLDFATPVMAVGLQIQAQFPGPFRALMEARYRTGEIIGSVELDGLSTFDQDGSALFLGLKSFAPDISRITITLTSSAEPNFLDFAINQVSIHAPTPVPEGLSLSVFGWTTLGLLIASRRARR